MSEIVSCFVTQSTGLRRKKYQAIVAIKAAVVAKGIFLLRKDKQTDAFTDFRSVIATHCDFKWDGRIKSQAHEDVRGIEEIYEHA